jgi:hypothetical protein
MRRARKSSHSMPRVSIASAVMTPRPGAANGEVPKNCIGMAFWIAGVPGRAVMVKVKAPRAIVAATRSRRGLMLRGFNS